jgi:hypothetical protein
MANFNQTSASLSATRTFTVPITDAAVFDAVIETLLADTSMALTKKEKSKETYIARFEYLDAAGELKSTASATGHSRAEMAAITTHMTSDATAAVFAGTDAAAVESLKKASWNVRVACAIGDDTLNVSLNRDDLIISGYAKAETLAVFETWADTIDALA